MCGIAGFYHPRQHYLEKESYYKTILNNMTKRLNHRGPDEQGIYLNEHIGLAHARLSIIDLVSGGQPMLRSFGDRMYVIVYNGELYNTEELKKELQQQGMSFQTTCDTEVLLLGFIANGPDFVKKLNGIFAYAIIDVAENSLYLFRDQAGVKPLFYTLYEDTLIFSSEIKGLFEYPGFTPKVTIEGLNEIFSIGPAKTPGCGVFDKVKEVLPGEMVYYNPSAFRKELYWKLVSKPHEDSYEETVERTGFLITDAIRRQMVSDVPICTFLSGGIDSSIVTAVCAMELKKKNKQLDTFSFDFVNNEDFFKANKFQPSRDLPYALKMVEHLNTNHHLLECDNVMLVNRLHDSVLARDLPAMADIDSSILHFCSLVKQYDKVALTGECADEIFGGYPWFHSEEAKKSRSFPWSSDLSARKQLLNDEFLQTLRMDEYVQNTYEATVRETPYLAEDSKDERKLREISYLNLKWFMQTLLDRMDRTSMYSGLEARVPFADIRIIEYLWNVPFSMKAPDGIVKGLLRMSCNGLLPDDILWRKKSPYPKTYDPGYESLVAARLLDVMNDGSSPLTQFIDKKKLDSFLHTPSDYGKPWYGQLMAGPQTLAYLLMINDWLETYHVEVVM